MVAAADVSAQDVAGARSFLAAVYAPYVAGKSTDPLGPRAPELFAPALLSLIRQDRSAAHGEAGLLDHDPFCACQDYDRLTSLKIEVAPTAGGAAASVSFVNGSHPVSLRLSLIDAGRGWRVADVDEPQLRSLRAYLASGLAHPPQDARPGVDGPDNPAGRAPLQLAPASGPAKETA